MELKTAAKRHSLLPSPAYLSCCEKGEKANVKTRRKYPRVKCPVCGHTHALIDGRIWNHVVNRKQCKGAKMTYTGEGLRRVELGDSMTVIVTQDHSLGEDEIYAEFFFCYRCDFQTLLRTFKYCPGCGAKLNTTAIQPALT